MPRTISAASIAKLSQNLGTEPINIIEIQWVDGGQRTSYADRDIAGGIKGNIIELSGLDAVVQVSGGSQSEQISVTLNDTDGELKSIIDSTDPHKRPCWVYQWFDGIPTDDKFLIFKGVINTPVEWNEGDRTLKFDIISKIEDAEVGFSIEEGDFIDPPEELIGKPWPLCFGTVINVPALKTKSARQGILASGTGIHDFTLEKRIQAADRLTCPMNFVALRTTANPGIIEPFYESDENCTRAVCVEQERLALQLEEQLAFETPTIRIFGGNKFPQNTLITLNINGGKFTGTFSGEIFTIAGRLHPQNDGHGEVIVDEVTNQINSECGISPAYSAGGPSNPLFAALGAWEDSVHPNEPIPQVIHAQRSKASWDYYHSIKSSSFFWANAGATVTLDSDEDILYIVNLLPSTILRVAAYRELSGGRQLVTVPDAYYTVRQTDYTGYTGVMELVFDRPLNLRDTETGGGWSDDVYVTMTSSVGPNTVDIIEWFVGKYTSYTVDSDSFNTVRMQIDNYPMHFPLLVRKNIINVLEEIAYQARCALWLKDDVFYIKYLALEPSSDGTITEDDVLPNTFVLEHTKTEDLVTKYVARWQKDYALDKPNTLIYRHNVAKYGTHQKDYNFYCFNIQSLVRKAATFWLIRKANTWRRAKFSTPINKLALETFDTASITLPDAADGTVKCMVEKANFNSDTRTIDFELWTPIKSGSRTPYDFAWPAAIEELALFPTIEERELGLAGSGHGPNFTTIAPPGHELSPTRASGSFQGEAWDIDPEDRPRDFGDLHPSDIGDTKPVPNAAEDQTGEIHTGTSPITTGTSAGSGNCCQEALDRANKALSEAQAARADAKRADENAGGEGEQDIDEAKSDLPDKGCGGGNCLAVATIQYIRVSQIQKEDLSFSSDEGATGKIINGTFPSKTECYTMNSAVAAQELRNSMVDATNALSDGFGASVGEEYAWVTSTASGDLGVDNNPDSDNFGQACPEPGAENQQITGFHEESDEDE